MRQGSPTHRLGASEPALIFHAQIGAASEAQSVRGCHPLQMRRSVLIVDDHDGFRTVAHALLDEAGFHVLGEAVDGASAISACEELDPDIVLLDVQLPDLDGFQVADALAAGGAPGRPLIVLISTREAHDYRAELSGAPVRGFISKSELSGPALCGLVET